MIAWGGWCMKVITYGRIGQMTLTGFRSGVRKTDGSQGFGLAEHTTWPEFVTIDLAASPKRSNYQRYFADLGTFDEICRIVDEICSEEAAKNPYQCPHWCPLEVWTEPYASIFDANELCRIAFKLWLQQEATV